MARTQPRFQFVATPASDGVHILQTYTLDAYDEPVVRDVLVYAREHAEHLSPGGQPLQILTGFTTPGRRFDIAVLVSPAVHKAYRDERRELHAITFLVFPAYQGEYSGRETIGEAELRSLDSRGILLANLNRMPSTYVKLRYNNVTTKAGTTGDKRGFTKVHTMARELELLENSPGSFVEFENRLGQVWRVEWDGRWSVTGACTRHIDTVEAVLDFAYAALDGRGA
ncbi:hypothetical protein KDK95_17740 [Actinospica sp. MGRD01-02]|uniref:Uncharacterized protein n=1 Tax=Actinospica acidithermotolerans TaxID=2828514 RepID=A0A941IIB5_9ACTN|nr:hypothetical protein [Actinospica acidithermotolerans]MBR7828164.1 hypothetical protein [Actinospica acidithermotolerans]